MLIMGMEAWQRLAELRRVAQWYAVYAAVMPIVHGLIAFALLRVMTRLDVTDAAAVAGHYGSI